MPRLNPSTSPQVEAESVLSHAKEAESQGFSSRPTLASEVMPRWGMANVGETHFPPELLIEKSKGLKWKHVFITLQKKPDLLLKEDPALLKYGAEA